VPPQFSSEYPVQRAGNGKATAALVLGIASILLCWLSFLDIVPVVLAIVFGSLGRAQANRDPRAGGKGMALAGLICGVVGAVLAIIVSILFIRISNDCSGLPTGGSAFSDCVRHHL
jgi:Na+/proline symporter